MAPAVRQEEGWQAVYHQKWLQLGRPDRLVLSATSLTRTGARSWEPWGSTESRLDIGELARNLNAQCARSSQSQAQVYNLSTTYSNYSNLSTYNHNGYSDYSYLLDEYEEY